MAIYDNRGIHFNVDGSDSGGAKSSLSAHNSGHNPLPTCGSPNHWYSDNFLYVHGYKVLSFVSSNTIHPAPYGCWLCNLPNGCVDNNPTNHPWSIWNNEINAGVAHGNLTWHPAGTCRDCSLAGNSCCPPLPHPLPSLSSSSSKAACIQKCIPCPTGTPGQVPPQGPPPDGQCPTWTSSAGCCPYEPKCDSNTRRFFRLIGWGCDARCYTHTLVRHANTVTARAPNQIEINYQNLFWPPNSGSYGDECLGQILLIDGNPWWFENQKILTLNADGTCAAWWGADAVHGGNLTKVDFADGPWEVLICEGSKTSGSSVSLNPVETDVCVREITATFNCTTAAIVISTTATSCVDYNNLPAATTYGVPQYNDFYEDTNCGVADSNGNIILRFKAVIIDSICTNGVCGQSPNPLSTLFDNFLKHRNTTNCKCPQPMTGACCISVPNAPDQCAVGTAAACSAIGGTYLGDGTDCVPNPCSSSQSPNPQLPPSDSSSSSSISSQSPRTDSDSSSSSSFSPRTDSDSSSSSSFSPRTDSDSSSSSSLSPRTDSDSSSSSSFSPRTDSDSSSSSSFSPKSDSDNSSSSSKSSSSPVPPPQPVTGACCVGKNCLVTTAATCYLLNGIFRGKGTTCYPNPCVSSSSSGSPRSWLPPNPSKAYYYFDEYYCEDLKTDTYNHVCHPSLCKTKRKRTIRVDITKSPCGHVCADDPNGTFYFVTPPYKQHTGVAWPEILEVTSNPSKSPASIVLKYSFIKAGNKAGETLGTLKHCVSLEDHKDGSVSHSQFVSEITAALVEWKTLFQHLYPWLTLNFQNLGDETGTKYYSHLYAPDYPIPNTDNVGDLRFGMHDIDGPESTLAHGYWPAGEIGVKGNVGGDIHFDLQEDWRLDSTSHNVDAAYSVKLVAAHEIGHALGLGHSNNGAALMYPAASITESFSTKFNLGLKYSAEDKRYVQEIYGKGVNP